MEIINIVGKNYCGRHDKTRIACRGIIIDNGKILLSYETKTDTWMIPGGGVEDNETDEQCCIREIAEETGLLVKTSNCLFEIDEYYENNKFVNKYFVCEICGTTQKKLTPIEIDIGLEPRWLQISQIKEIFSKYNLYKDIDENRRGMYLREYTALNKFFNGSNHY